VKVLELMSPERQRLAKIFKGAYWTFQNEEIDWKVGLNCQHAYHIDRRHELKK
jgi:hypothetical protein